MADSHSITSAASSRCPSPSPFQQKDTEPKKGPAINVGSWALLEDPVAVSQTLARPASEPPVINFLPLFDSEDMKKIINEGRITFGIERATRFLDAATETFVLRNYIVWAVECGHEAIERGEGEKERYYEGLCHAIREELAEQMVECREIVEGIFESMPGHQFSPSILSVVSTRGLKVPEEWMKKPFRFRDARGKVLDPWAEFFALNFPELTPSEVSETSDGSEYSGDIARRHPRRWDTCLEFSSRESSRDSSRNSSRDSASRRGRQEEVASLPPSRRESFQDMRMARNPSPVPASSAPPPKIHHKIRRGLRRRAGEDENASRWGDVVSALIKERRGQSVDRYRSSRPTRPKLPRAPASYSDGYLSASDNEYLSARSEADSEDLIDLSSPTFEVAARTATGNLAELLRNTGIGEMGGVDRAV